MMNITISFDNINEAMVAINAVKTFQGAVNDFTPEVALEVTSNADAPNGIVTPAVAQAIIDALVSMDSDELADKFGTGKDKPYRVLKANTLSELQIKLGIDTDEAEAKYDISSSTEDILKAINVIITDISDGGLSHDEFEDLFEVRTSKKLFEQNSLDEIVRELKESEYI